MAVMWFVQCVRHTGGQIKRKQHDVSLSVLVFCIGSGLNVLSALFTVSTDRRGGGWGVNQDTEQLTCSRHVFTLLSLTFYSLQKPFWVLTNQLTLQLPAGLKLKIGISNALQLLSLCCSASTIKRHLDYAVSDNIYMLLKTKTKLNDGLITNNLSVTS